MQVKNLIQPSATVVRVTEVGQGAIYKRLDTPSYGEPRILFGVVTDVLHDGESAAVVAVEFQPQQYAGGFEPRVRTFAGDGEVAIYPATEEEWRAGLAEAIAAQARVVETAARDLASKTAVMETLARAAENGIALVTTTALEVTA